MSYERLTDKEFLDLIFSKGDMLGEDFLKEARKRRDFILPYLRRIVLDELNYQREDEEFWGVVHAVHLLGILEDKEGIEALFSALEYSDKYNISWIWEALPECFLRIGKTSLPKLMEYLKNNNDVPKTLTVMESIWNLYERFPEERLHIEKFFLNLLNDVSVDPEIKGYIIADFAKMGRSDLKSLFDRLFERGEIDLKTVTPNDIDNFLKQRPEMPTFIVEIEKFYSKEAIEERQERWREEKELEFIDFLLENYNKIGRNEPCPCGSGKKFKKCHLPIIEAKRRELAETRERLNKLMENAAVISVLKETEMKMRQILAKQDKAYLFKEIEKNIIEAIRIPDEEFVKRGMSYYLQPIFDKLEFQNEKEAEEFSGFLMDYWNAIAYLYKGFGDYSH